MAATCVVVVKRSSAMESILVLGGTGFIGSALVRQLCRDGFRVRSASRTGTPTAHPGVDYRHLDLQSAAKDRDLLTSIDTVCCVVGSLFPAAVERDVLKFTAEYLYPMFDFAERCSRRGIPIVFASSGGTVYGRPDRLPVDESAPTRPLSHYGALMRSVEMFLSIVRRSTDVPHKILRLGNVYGPGQRPAHGYALVPNVMAAMAKGRPFSIWGDGEMQRDYVYVDDVVEAFVRAVTFCGDEETFNIGTGVGVTVNEVVDEVESAGGVRVRRKYVQLTQPIHTPHIALESSLAREKLGWSPKVALPQGICRTWQAFRYAGQPTALDDQ